MRKCVQKCEYMIKSFDLFSEALKLRGWKYESNGNLTTSSQQVQDHNLQNLLPKTQASTCSGSVLIWLSHPSERASWTGEMVHLKRHR